jgi:hypothetical protein
MLEKNGTLHVSNWDFGQSLFFSMTIVTTIGEMLANASNYKNSYVVVYCPNKWYFYESVYDYRIKSDIIQPYLYFGCPKRLDKKPKENYQSVSH